MINRTFASLLSAKTKTHTQATVVVALLVITFFAAPSIGLWHVAEAAILNNDPKGDARDQEGNAIPDLDIKKAGFESRKVYIQVYGIAGGTVADHDHAIAYVITILTADGELQTWAIDSHEKQHGDTHTGEEWHAHHVHLGDNPNTVGVIEPDRCVNEVDEVNHAMMEGNRAIFENMVVKGKDGNLESVSTVTITSALTGELHVLVDDPDNPGDAPCIAEVSWSFDSM